MRDHLDYGMLRLDGITEILRNNHQHITATITHQRADLIEMNGMSCEHWGTEDWNVSRHVM